MCGIIVIYQKIVNYVYLYKLETSWDGRNCEEHQKRNIEEEHQKGNIQDNIRESLGRIHRI